MYHLTIGGQPLAIETNFSETHAWLKALQARFLEEEIAIAEKSRRRPPTWSASCGCARITPTRWPTPGRSARSAAGR